MSSEEDAMFKRADKMFARADKMFANMFKEFPRVSNKGFFSKVTYTSPVEVKESVEYKLVKPDRVSSKEDIEKWLNKLGADGWDLNCFEYGYAIFSRFVEVPDEAEEPES